MKGRIPACCSITFEGGITTSGHVSSVRNNTFNTLNNQGLSGNNTFTHNPFNPKTFISPPKHKRAPTLLDIIKDFTESYFSSKEHKKLYYHLDDTGNASRQIRSEFREMISMGCSILTHYYDVITGEIGYMNQGGSYIRYSYRQLAERLNVSLLRVKRFFKFLKQRNYITIIENKKKDKNGNWKSNVSRKIINPSFFINTLGLKAWKKISSYKEWLQKKNKPKTYKDRANISVMKSLMNTRRANPKANKCDNDGSLAYQEKQYVEKALLLHEQDPTKPLSQYLKELKGQKS